ncbi:MAG: NAD(P)-binding domain-containing protein [Chthoniobacterales bacterium]
MKQKNVAIIGAGPIGLDAALAAEAHGYDFTVYEGGVVGDAVRQWGHVRMFSPFAMNSSAAGRERLRSAGVHLPASDSLLTGGAFRERYLQPLARTFGAQVQEQTHVLAVGRARRLKGDFIGAAERGTAPFRLLLRDAGGERVAEANIVLDCSGTYGQSNSLGEGGIPVPGETACAERIHYGVPDFAESTAQRFLVVGAGHSAATVVRDLARGAGEVTWLIRRPRELPAEEVPNDPLPERARLAAAANDLVRSGRVRLLRDAVIGALEPTGSGVKVHWRNAASEKGILEVDEIVAATGFRPDLSLTRELQLQTCWATEGTYPLAASLLGEAGADCLATPVFGAETLLHPEPGFFTLGMKSYGRAPNFLLRTGYEQVASVFAWLEKNTGALLTR